MTTAHLIAADEFCGHHQLEQSFIIELHDAGLVHITVVDERRFFPEEELPALERMIRMHRDLEINIAGIASVTHLLGRMEQMQREMLLLRNRLQMYED